MFDVFDLNDTKRKFILKCDVMIKSYDFLLDFLKNLFLLNYKNWSHPVDTLLSRNTDDISLSLILK